MAKKKSERALTGRAGGERIHLSMHRSLCCLISRETLFLWRVAPHSSSFQAGLKQLSLPQKKRPGREMFLYKAAPIRSINIYQPDFLMSYGCISCPPPSVLEHAFLRGFPISNLNLLK